MTPNSFLLFYLISLALTAFLVFDVVASPWVSRPMKCFMISLVAIQLFIFFSFGFDYK